MKTAEQQHNDIENRLFDIWLSEYKKKIIKYLKEGDDYYVFQDEISAFYEKKSESFIKSNPKYSELKRLFLELQHRKAIDKFNKVIHSDRFENELNQNEISKEEFIKLHAEFTNIESIKYVHTENREIVKSIFSIYYNNGIKKKIDLLNLSIFNGRDYYSIKKEKTRLNNILHPPKKNKNNSTISKFNIELSTKEISVFMTFIRDYFNISPKYKNDISHPPYLKNNFYVSQIFTIDSGD